MAWFTRFNPMARLQGERDVSALIFFQCFIPKLETDVINAHYLVQQGYTCRGFAKECSQTLLHHIVNDLGPHLSRLQLFNHSRNLEAVSIGISRDIDMLLWSGEVFRPDGLTFDLKRLTRALDLIVFDTGMRALRAANDKAINMSVDAVSSLIESTFDHLLRQRIAYGNPYRDLDYWNLRPTGIYGESYAENAVARAAQRSTQLDAEYRGISEKADRAIHGRARVTPNGSRTHEQERVHEEAKKETGNKEEKTTREAARISIDTTQSAVIEKSDRAVHGRAKIWKDGGHAKTHEQSVSATPADANSSREHDFKIEEPSHSGGGARELGSSGSAYRRKVWIGRKVNCPSCAHQFSVEAQTEFLEFGVRCHRCGQSVLIY
jgi:hypothetical protein